MGRVLVFSEPSIEFMNYSRLADTAFTVKNDYSGAMLFNGGIVTSGFPSRNEGVQMPLPIFAQEMNIHRTGYRILGRVGGHF
jgi:hypothetical protein